MSESEGGGWRLGAVAVVLGTIAISAVFVAMIRDFLTALFLAAVCSAIAAPLYNKILALAGQRRGLASALTLIALLLLVLVPLFAILYLAALQAEALASDVFPFIQGLDLQSIGPRIPDWIPFKAEIAASIPQITAKIGEFTGRMAQYFVVAASAFTKGTVQFFLSLFVMIYAMYFFLQRRTGVLTELGRYSGLSESTRDHLVERIVSISRATIKGTLVIGVVQGVLGGIGFAVTGISGAAFWGVVMAIASVIPGIGPGLVLTPAVIYLLATGETVAAIGLAIWSVAVVTTVDNFLRPTLVGHDAKMPDLLILVSTFGGLAMFGAVGLIIGPVIAGLFVAMWEIFVETFGDDPDDG